LKYGTLNGFPPDYYEMNEKAEKLKKKIMKYSILFFAAFRFESSSSK
jgi:hypothetical protein